MEEVGNFPVFWNEQQTSWVQGSTLIDEVESRKKKVEGDYKAICEVLPRFERFSFERFLWCRTVVGSRNFSITIGDEKRTAMVPQADMLNHLRPRETSWTFDNDIGCFTITSLTTLRAGQQVMDSYGRKCNSKFLLHYGFSVENNREADGTCLNELSLLFQLRKADPAAKQKLQLVSEDKRFRITVQRSDAAVKNCLSYLRVVAADADEVSLMSAMRPNNMMSTKNELAALLVLQDKCRTKLCFYPTTLEEDERVLKYGQLEPFSDRRNALIVI